MQNKHTEDLFFYLSKITIFLPLLIIILALFLEFNNRTKVKSKTAVVNNKIITPQIGSRQSMPDINSLFKQVASKEAQFDLRGPWVCNYNTDKATASAYIRDRQITATIQEKTETQNILVKNDCVYLWDQGEYTGQKACGISSYLDLFDSLQSLNLVNMNDLLSAFSQFYTSTGEGSLDLKKINMVQSCKKKEVNNNVFILPKNVLFKNLDVLNLTPYKNKVPRL